MSSVQGRWNKILHFLFNNLS